MCCVLCAYLGCLHDVGTAQSAAGFKVATRFSLLVGPGPPPDLFSPDRPCMWIGSPWWASTLVVALLLMCPFGSGAQATETVREESQDHGILACSLAAVTLTPLLCWLNEQGSSSPSESPSGSSSTSPSGTPSLSPSGSVRAGGCGRGRGVVSVWCVHVVCACGVCMWRVSVCMCCVHVLCA